MIPVRDFNMEVSLKVFCGPHIPQHAVKEISDKYWQITKALELVNFPLALPGTKIYGAVQARKVAMKYLTKAAEKSKAAMAAGGQVECLIDAWGQEIMAMDEQAVLSKDGATSKTKRDFSAHEIAQVVLSFLFASQDAMSSGIIYMFQHLADHPDVLARICEEQIRVREGDLDKPMTLEMLDDMPYLRACVRESLRVKPPVTMVRPSARSLRTAISIDVMTTSLRYRCRTRQLEPSPSQTTTPSQVTAWSFHPSILRYSMDPSTKILIHSNRKDG